MKMWVCEDERMKWTEEERSAAWSGWDAVRGWREGFRGQGEGRPDCAATEMLSAAWLPPKDSASFPPTHLAPVSPLFPLPPLSPSLTSLLLLSLPSFTLQFLALFFSLHSSISLTCLVFFPPFLVWAITDTQQRAERRGYVAGEIEGGTKALRCSGPPRVAGFEKKPGGFLMQRVDGQTRIDRQSRLSPLSSSLSSSFSWCLFWPKKHIIRLVPFPLRLMFYQTH